MSDDVILEARGLVPAYFPDHRPLNLDVRLEQIVCCVGPNNTGKSAWMRTLAGVDPPVQGEIRLLGNDVWSLDAMGWRSLRRDVGFVGARAQLLSVVDGLTNVMLPAIHHQLADAETLSARALNVLGRLGWNGDLNALPAFLDEHEQRTLALARCLILEPSMVFIDEPFSLVDQRSRQAMESLFARLCEDDGLTLVITTHNLTFAEERADFLLYADGQGLVKYDDWSDLAVRHAEFVADPSAICLVDPDSEEATADA